MASLSDPERLSFLNELASFYPSPQEARDLLDSSGLPVAKLPQWSEATRPAEFWWEVCRKLEQGLVKGGLAPLVANAVKMFPHNAIFTHTRDRLFDGGAEHQSRRPMRVFISY